MKRERVRFALSIDHSDDDAWVTAMGSGGVAAEMVRAARRYGIPIIESSKAVSELRSTLGSTAGLPAKGVGLRAQTRWAR